MTKTATFGFAAVLLIVVLISAASIWSHAQARRDFDWALHTKAVQAEIARFLATLEAAETGQRGYLLTQEDRYLAPYRASIGLAEERFEALERLTRDNPSQQERLDAMAPVLDERIGLLRETVGLAEQGRWEEALALVETDRGQRAMDALRAATQEMYDHEAAVLARRSDRVARASRWNAVATAAGLALVLGAATAALGRMRRTERARAASEAQRARLEEQLLQARKMEALGQLAGGVAHDFNNLLTAILGYAEMARDGLGGEEPARDDVEEILGAARQAADLTTQLLAFSRKQVLEVQPLDLNDAVRAMSKLLRRVIGEHVQLETNLQPSLGTVEADPSQMRQVVLNLAINARDAMPEGGRLVIETADVELDEGYAARRPEVEPGRYVMIAVSDTGVGMDAATQARIFEPFFTTKGPGRGTGLGLATVHGVVKQTGGHVWVYSEPGRGTTFRIYFPRVDRVAQPVSFDEGALRQVLRGAETVLLCEDEATLRRLVRTTLERRGYRVLEAESPERALEIAARPETGKVDLLVTDVIMPNMNGRQLAEKLAEANGLRAVLYVSGYTQNIIAHHGVLKPGVHFLPKPFTQDALLRKVREVVESAEKP